MTTVSKPAKTAEELEAEKKAAEKAAKHKEMLKKLSAKRVPRVVDSIRSVGGLSVHNPTPAQIQAIVKPLQDALALTIRELNGEAKKQPTFSLPD
jgi:hypothetical protein